MDRVKDRFQLFSALQLSTAPAPILIAVNEIMASNVTTILDEDGDVSDWIELYNYGTVAYDLEGFGLSDSDANPFKWIFPSYTIQPGEYLLVWASNKNRTNPKQSAAHEFRDQFQW
jgi:hypothetical protein